MARSACSLPPPAPELGYLGLTIGWVEGLEVNFLGAVLGLDIRRPALKLPGIGRLGMMAGI